MYLSSRIKISRMGKKGKKKRKWVRRVRKENKLRTLRKIVSEEKLVLKRIKQRIKMQQTTKELVNWMFLHTSLLRYVSIHKSILLLSNIYKLMRKKSLPI